MATTPPAPSGRDSTAPSSRARPVPGRSDGRHADAMPQMPCRCHADAVRIFFTIIKGAPSARHAARARPRLARMRGTCTENVNEQEVLCRSGAGWWGLSPQVAGQPDRFLLHESAPSRAAARGPLPRTSPQHAPRRNALCMTAPDEDGQAVVACQVCRSPGEKITAHRAGTPHIVWAGSSSLNGASHPRCAPTRLRRAVDPGDLGQPSGPDGKGQAKGKARGSRGEPRRTIRSADHASESIPDQ
jgi:hypothetical protein